MYFVKEVRIDGGKHLYHNIIVALFTDSLNIYRQSLSLVSYDLNLSENDENVGLARRSEVMLW